MDIVVKENNDEHIGRFQFKEEDNYLKIKICVLEEVFKLKKRFNDNDIRKIKYDIDRNMISFEKEQSQIKIIFASLPPSTIIICEEIPETNQMESRFREVRNRSNNLNSLKLVSVGTLHQELVFK